MKVQVKITNLNKDITSSTTMEATVGPTDTVLSVQELITSVTKTFVFPDQKLLFKGKEFPGNQSLTQCGIKDGDMLEFVFQASEQTLVQQLSDLLGKQAMSPDELGLLYSYRYAVSFEDTLKALGHTTGKLRSFLESQKCFSFANDLVKVVQANTKALQQPAALCPIKEDKAHGLIEVKVSVEVRVPGRSPKLLSLDEEEEAYMRLESSETVLRSKEIIAASQQMPFPDRELWLGSHQLQDDVPLAESGVKNGSALLMVVNASEASLASQLEELLAERTGLSPSDIGLHYCQRYGTPLGQALRTLGIPANVGRFLEGHSQFSLANGCVTLSNGPKLTTPPTEQEELDALDALDYVIDLICEASFLSIDRVKREHCVAGEVHATALVNGLPQAQQAPLLQGLQKAVASTLQALRDEEPSIQFAGMHGDKVKVDVEGSQTVFIRLAAAPPCFK